MESRVNKTAENELLKALRRAGSADVCEDVLMDESPLRKRWS